MRGTALPGLDRLTSRIGACAAELYWPDFRLSESDDRSDASKRQPHARGEKLLEGGHMHKRPTERPLARQAPVRSPCLRLHVLFRFPGLNST
jgi:hypothetical protein